MSVFDAAKTGDLEALRAADLSVRQPPYDWTLLHVAAANGQLAAVELLLERGHDVDAREAGDNTCAIHWAAADGHLDVVRALADAGADVVGSDDDHALSVIGWATCWDSCHADVAAFLVERGAQPHIFSALALGDGDSVREIVGADPGALNRRMSRTEDHQLPLQFAIRKGLPEMVALLMELGADPLGVDASGHTVAAYATAPDIDRAAMEAVHALTSAELASSARAHRPPNARPLDLIAALTLGEHAAAGRLTGAIEPGVLHVMAKRNDVAAVRWLLEHGADVNARWSHWGASATALHLAAAFGHTEVAQVLLDAGADASLHDSRYDGDALAWARHFEQAATITLLESVPVRDTGADVVVEFRERDAHLRTILDAFDGWIVGIQSQAGLLQLDLQTPGATWGASVSLVEDQLERLPFDWRSHAVCRRP